MAKGVKLPGRKPIELTWHFKTFLDQYYLDRHATRSLDHDRLIRFFLSGCLDARILREFEQWIKRTKY